MKSRHFVPAIACAFLMISCAKDNTLTRMDLASVDPSVPESIDIYSTKSYTQTEFSSFLGASFDDYLEEVGSTSLNALLKPVVFGIFESNSSAVNDAVAQELDCSELVARTKWGVKIYDYTYNTISYTGEPIKLSAALCVPYITDGSSSHTLKAMSLCPPHMPLDKEFCPTVNGTILMARLAYNHAVVVPDYQGRGVTSSGSYSSMHTHDHAVQAIHAALAARTILEQQGYSFANDFSLYNVGVSEGGEAAYEAQKLIENDIPDEQREKLNLKLTFSANGIAQHAKYVTTQMNIFEYTGEESFIEEMDFYADTFDCFTEAEKQGHKREELYADDILDENKKIVLDHPMIRVLQEGLQRNDITYNWNPRHPLALAASHDDNDVLFDENAQYMYDLVKNTPDGKANGNVTLLDFDTPISAKVSDYLGPDYMFAHIAADVCCFVHAIRYENPGSEPINTNLFGTE